MCSYLVPRLVLLLLSCNFGDVILHAHSFSRLRNKATSKAFSKAREIIQIVSYLLPILPQSASFNVI